MADDEKKAAELRAAALAKAQEILRRDPNAAAGLRAMHNVNLSMGLVPLRKLLTTMVEGKDSEAALVKKINDIEPDADMKIGIDIDFHNELLGARSQAHLYLDVCAPDHDLGAQIGKILSYVKPEKKPEIMRHFSMLIGMGMQAYCVAVEKHRETIASAMGVASPAKMLVDPANTTIYLDGGSKKRIGIFVEIVGSNVDDSVSSK